MIHHDFLARITGRKSCIWSWTLFGALVSTLVWFCMGYLLVQIAMILISDWAGFKQ